MRSIESILATSQSVGLSPNDLATMRVNGDQMRPLRRALLGFSHNYGTEMLPNY